MLTSLLTTGFLPAAGTELFEDKGMLMAVITCAGILIVFMILVLLIVIFYAYGGIFRAVTRQNNKNAAQKTPAVEKSQSPAPAPASPAPADDGSIPDEIIAVIAAAVAAWDDGKKYTVKKIARAQRAAGSRSAWAAMGIYENTRPF